MGSTTRVRVGCRLTLQPSADTAAVVQVQPRTEPGQTVLSERLESFPAALFHLYRDLYGNSCQRITLPAGEVAVEYDAVVEVSTEPDRFEPGARELAPLDLPDDVLIFTMPSRYCLSDQLGDDAWRMFGSLERGWSRVQAVCDWVHGNIRFQYGSSNPLTTAADIYRDRVGVCRDFAHLAVTLLRAINIPTRYVFGYLPDIGLPENHTPDEMDFAAWIEVFLDGRWWTFDPRNNVRRIGRAVIGRGRDALDVAMLTSYGRMPLNGFKVWADELPPEPV